MPLVEHDHMVEHVATYAANDSFDVRTLPGAARRNLYFFDAQVLNALLEPFAIDCVTVHDVTVVVCQHDEHEQHAEGDS